MGRSVIITTPIPTADEMAKSMGMGKKRLAMIKRVARQVREGSMTSGSGVETTQGSGKRAKATG